MDRVGNLHNARSQRKWMTAVTAQLATGNPSEIATVTDFGAVGDGVNDDTGAFVAALAASDSVHVPPGTYLISSIVDLNAGKTLHGVAERSVLYGTCSTAMLRCFDYTTVHGFKFTGNGSAYGITNSTGADRHSVLVENCHFDIIRAIYIQGQSSSTTAQDWIIRNNYFENFNYGIYSVRLSRSLIDGNTFYSDGLTERAIFFTGGAGNRILANDIQGGITGITFLADYSSNASLAVPVGNKIAFNRIEGVKEESISFDSHGNSSIDNAARDYSTVASKSTSGGNYFVTLAGSWASSGTAYIGAYFCFMTGSLRGRAIEIRDHSAGTGQFNLRLTAAEYALVTAGDAVSIGLAAVGNVLIGNEIICLLGFPAATGISMYGMCYENVIVANSVAHDGLDDDQFGIRVTSLNGLTNGGFLGVTGRAPSMGNLVQGNVLRGCGLRLHYQTYSADPDFQSYGNVIGPNRVSGRLEITRHENLCERSTGNLPSALSNTTAHPVAYTKAETLPLAQWRHPTSQHTTLGNAAAAGICGLSTTAGDGIRGVATNNTASTESCQISFRIPADYLAGEVLTFRIRGRVGFARFVTQTVGITLKEYGDAVLGADICATSPQSLTTSYADYSFTITPTSLLPGDWVQVVMTLTANDTGGSGGSSAMIVTKTWFEYTARV